MRLCHGSPSMAGWFVLALCSTSVQDRDTSPASYYTSPLAAASHSGPAPEPEWTLAQMKKKKKKHKHKCRRRDVVVVIFRIFWCSSITGWNVCTNGLDIAVNEQAICPSHTSTAGALVCVVLPFLQPSPSVCGWPGSLTASTGMVLS